MKITENINLTSINILHTSIIFFILGLIYYFIKFNNIRRNMPTNTNTNTNFAENNHRNNNYNEEETNRSVNIKFKSSHNSLSVDVSVDKNSQIGDFLKSNIYSSLDISHMMMNVTIIFRGRRVNENQTFSQLAGIDNGSIINLFVTYKEGNQSNNQSQSTSQNQNHGDNYNMNDNLNYIHINTLKTNGYILIIICFVIFHIKDENEVISTKTKIILYSIILFWWIQLSYIISKLIVFKSIKYEEE